VEVITMAGKVRAIAGPVRLARLFVGRNKMRRPSDRLEGLVVVLLSAVFVAAIAAAPWFGARLYHSERAGAARLHPATAVLTERGPSESYLTTAGEANARWRAPDGREQTGVLTTVTAPAISGAAAGSRVRVWLTESGQPQAPPLGAFEATFSSVVFAFAAVCGAGIALVVCYWLCRVVLDRRRLAGWASEWSLTGPRWTTRL
jgi:hypothetical protein